MGNDFILIRYGFSHRPCTSHFHNYLFVAYSARYDRKTEQSKKQIRTALNLWGVVFGTAPSFVKLQFYTIFLKF